MDEEEEEDSATRQSGGENRRAALVIAFLARSARRGWRWASGNALLDLGACWAWPQPGRSECRDRYKDCSFGEIFTGASSEMNALCRGGRKVSSLGGLLDRAMVRRRPLAVGILRSPPAGKCVR